MRFLVLAAFLFSGFTGLVLENLWVRMLVLVFGGTTLAIVTVLTAFMGGLALGSYLAGKVAHRIERPIMVYGFLEAGVALYSLCLPFAFDALPWVYRLIPLDWPFGVTAFVRFVICSLLLLVPTTLMGATLPILSHYFVRHRQRIGFDVGMLYSINTFGAVVGALTGGFVLLPWFGHRATLWGVAGGLMSLAFLMLLVGSGIRMSEKAQEEGLEGDLSSVGAFEQIRETMRGNVWLSRAVVLSIAVTGATAMICQVIWSRALAMVIGSSTYAFTLILGTFLLGLALGAAWGAWIARRSLDLVRSWSYLLFGTGVAVAFGVLVIDRLPVLFVMLAHDVVKRADPMVLFGIKALMSSIPILIPTLLMGTFFPLALAIYGWNEQQVGQNVGQVYAANTVGSIVGSAIAGFLVIPTLSMQGGLSLCVCLYLLCALSLRLAVKDEGRWVFGTVAVVGIASIWLFPSWHPGRMGLGMFRLSLFNSYTYRQAMTPGHVLFYKEGVSATVSVEGTKTHRALKVNGKTDASNVGDRATQIGVAALPLLFHGQPKSAAIVGWGSGMTVGAALVFPLDKMVAIELEPQMVAGSRFFDAWNFRPLRHLKPPKHGKLPEYLQPNKKIKTPLPQNKRLHLYYNDGRNYLATTREKFDVLISEPSNPWISGVANLFTVEYFKIAKARLKPGGVFCQWVQIYELSYENITMILRSVRKVFPYVRLFEVENDSYDKVVIASMSPLQFDLAKLDTMIRKPSLNKIFQPMGLESSFDLIPRLLAGEKEIDRLLKQGPKEVNTDNHNLLEFRAPLDLVRQYRSNDASRFTKRLKKNEARWTEYFSLKGKKPKGSDALAAWRGAIIAQLRYGEVGDARKLYNRLNKIPAPKPLVRKTLFRILQLMDGKEYLPDMPKKAQMKAKDKKRWKIYLKARKLYEKDKHDKCVEELKKLEDKKHKAFVDAHPEVTFFLGACSRYADKYGQGIKYYKRFIQQTPKTTQKTKVLTKQPTTNPSQPPTSQPKPTSHISTKPTSQPSTKPTSQPTTHPKP